MDITQCLLELCPSAEFVVRENDYSKVEWHSSNLPMPTLAEVQAKAQEIAARNSYVAPRLRAYPPLSDQLDAIWKGGDEAEAMRAKILGVKAQFPKPEAGAI